MPCSGADSSDINVIPEKSTRIRVLLMAVFASSGDAVCAYASIMAAPISDSLIPSPVVFSAFLLNAVDVTNWQATRLMALS
jgi:hypothetical protein